LSKLILHYRHRPWKPQCTALSVHTGSETDSLRQTVWQTDRGTDGQASWFCH